MVLGLYLSTADGSKGAPGSSTFNLKMYNTDALNFDEPPVVAAYEDSRVKLIIWNSCKEVKGKS